MATMLCSQCGTAGDTKTQTKGSILIEIVLWCCFLIPGLIYSVWRLSSRGTVCGACGGASLIPANSPVGRQLAAKYHSNVQLDATPAPSAKRGMVWIGVAVAIVAWIAYVNVSGH